MANDIKVIFHGTKAPSGKTTEIEYMINSERAKLLKSSGMFDMEVLNKADAKPKKKKAAAKKKKDK